MDMLLKAWTIAAFYEGVRHKIWEMAQAAGVF